MSEIEKRVLDDLRDREGEMLALLERIVSIDSQSRDKAGVDAVSGEIAGYLRSNHIAVEILPNAEFGDGLCVMIGETGKEAAKPIVLMGHCDTVFPKGEAAKRPFRIEGDRAYGPGVADMKGGLAMNAGVLAAIARSGANVGPVIGLFTVDEEIASPSSRPIIERVCKDARAVFNSEPGRPTGNVVAGRNGGIFFRVEMTGKKAHSGVNFGSGRSAIGETARKIIEIDDLVDDARAITANVGILGGGEGANIIAGEAYFEAEVRFRDPADGNIVRERIEQIAKRSNVPGVTSQLIVHGEFLPMQHNEPVERLFTQYGSAAESAGLAVASEFSGGCSDAGFAASLGVPVLCAVGPVGGNPHTEQEYIETTSLIPRACALALTIIRLS